MYMSPVTMPLVGGSPVPAVTLLMLLVAIATAAIVVAPVSAPPPKANAPISAMLQDTAAEPFTDFAVNPIVRFLAVVQVAALVAVAALPEMAIGHVPLVPVPVRGA